MPKPAAAAAGIVPVLAPAQNYLICCVIAWTILLSVFSLLVRYWVGGSAHNTALSLGAHFGVAAGVRLGR